MQKKHRRAHRKNRCRRPRVGFSNWWSDEYKLARLKQAGGKDSPPIPEEAYRLMLAEAEKGNGLAMHDVGKMLLTRQGCDQDEETAQEWFQKAHDAFFQMEQTARDPGYWQYRLGKLYCFGQGVPQNLELGMEWLKASASHGNEHAAALLEKVQSNIHRQTASAVFGLFRGLAGTIQTSVNNFIRRRNTIDRKQRQKIEEKKQAHGLRSSGCEYDNSEEQAM